MAYVIKRYSNRKLYDTQESRYVTLEELADMIRAGREVQVVDATSGEDLTSVTLTQIILESEKTHRASLPSAFLHQLIKHGEAWQDYFQRAMKSSLEGVVSSQREMDRVFREWATRSGWPAPGMTPPRAETRREGPVARETQAGREASGGREASAGREAAAGRESSVGTDGDAERLRDEVAALRERLKSLEERLERRRGDRTSG